MSKLSIIERLFSITNEEYYKVIRLLGFQYKIDRREGFYKKYGNLPLENKMVVSNFFGSKYGCNPKYVVEQVLKENLPIDIVWLVRNKEQYADSDIFPSKIRLVEYSSEDAMKELATAKVWLNNQRLIYHLRKGLTKKEGQCYIQTWHGSLGIKKLDADVKNFNTPEKQMWVDMAKYDSATMDYMLSNSTFEDNILPPALWFNNKLLKVGHPRNDVFFYPEEDLNSIKTKVYSALEIDENKKMILYVPSFRDDSSIEGYNLDYKDLVDDVKKRFGGDWVVVIRLHPRAKSKSEMLIPNEEYIVDGTLYPDVQELLVSAEIAITDYSSCIFDFMLSGKPGFIYAPDVEKYNLDRGFYYPLTATPFPVAENNEQMKENILRFDEKIYKQKTEDFLKEKGCIEDGHASERVVEIIKEKMVN
jgi:CDP-glycerol glycerophosphotransferase